MSTVIFSVGLIIFLAHFFTGLFERTRIPDVFMLMVLGILIGPVLGIIQPQDFGQIGKVATTVALIVILFEGGINLDIKKIKESLDETAYVAISTFIISMFLVSLAVWGFFKLEPIVAVMLGAILGGTTSAVVIPIIQKLKLSDLAYMILFLESAITDVICIVVTMSILSTYETGHLTTGTILGQIISSLILAFIIGFGGGVIWVAMIKRIKGFPESPVSCLAYIFVLYGIAEFLNFSGAITALAFGVTLANMKDFPVKKIRLQTYFAKFTREEITDYERNFFGDMVFLLKIFFFIYLGVSIKFGNPDVILIGFIITVLLFLGRYIIIRFIMPKRVNRNDSRVMSVLIPKGLAAAVLASIPFQKGIPGGEIVQDIAYMVILFSIAFAAGLVTSMEKNWLWTEKICDSIFSVFPKTISTDKSLGQPKVHHNKTKGAR
ncbi:sodium:proton exchanger [bacterium]|nr:MAG: sodium:proton exchanger [bacterium]